MSEPPNAHIVRTREQGGYANTGGLQINTAAVLGAGVMGAQIAAHLTNTGIRTFLFELPAAAADPNALARKAIENLKTIEPAPLLSARLAGNMIPANYGSDLRFLQDCDLVIEAISERIEWKTDLLRKVSPHLGAHTVLATNTSGLSINRLAQVLPAALRSRFCGMHFFNPPRYMRLVELIPGTETSPDLLDGLESFLVTQLGKGVVRARDTPNFIGNRIGIFALTAAMHHAGRLTLRPDLVDALTGTTLGRPASATYRTADIIGLDTYAHVLEDVKPFLGDDPWLLHMSLPDWLRDLIRDGALGKKAGRGVYRRSGKAIEVYDPGTREYVESGAQPAAEIESILREADPGKRLAALRESSHPQGQFVWSIFRDTFHYGAVHLEEIAQCARDVDLAMRWGYGWRQGPFECWQAAGWRDVAAWIAEDIAAQRTMSPAPLPSWVFERDGVHDANGSWSPSQRRQQARSSLSVYKRQLVPETLHGEPAYVTDTIFENPSARMWRIDHDIAVLSFRTRMNTINTEVLDSIQQAVSVAERDFAGLVIWQFDPPFSAGANLKEFNAMMQSHGPRAIEAVLRIFQRTTQRLRYARVPTVAAVRGLVLGGGCEVMMHCARVVAFIESQIGLVETGVGLLPAGGGCKELARRAAETAHNGNLFAAIEGYFQIISSAQLSANAEDARAVGLLQPEDVVIFNAEELLYVAIEQIRAMTGAGYRPPSWSPIAVAGQHGLQNLDIWMSDAEAAGQISGHDHAIGTLVAAALCGDGVEAGTELPEETLLELERRGFMELLQHPQSLARIDYMLATGQPLRN